MNVVWSIWLVALHAMLLLGMLAFGAYKAGVIFNNIDEGDQGFGLHYENMLSFQERSDPALPSNRIILIGDSLVQGLPASAISDLAVNYGIGGDTTLGVQFRLPKYKSIERAAAVVLAIGINDMRDVDNETIQTRYESILQMLPDNLAVYCSGVFPIDENVKRDWHGRSNLRYRDWNARLNTLCSADGSVYIPAPQAFYDENGSLPAQYHVGDGLHLNARGNAVWAAHLKQALE